MMNLDDLEFGGFQVIAPQIVEVNINDGVNMTIEMQDLVEQALEETFKGEKYCLLINRVNQYSHDAESLLRINEFKNLVALAILVYTNQSEAVAGIQSYIQERLDFNIFRDKETALEWLNRKVISS